MCAAYKTRVSLFSANFYPKHFPLRRTFSELHSRCARAESRVSLYVKKYPVLLSGFDREVDVPTKC
jgi:hypothetical protein